MIRLLIWLVAFLMMLSTFAGLICVDMGWTFLAICNFGNVLFCIYTFHVIYKENDHGSAN